MGELNPKLREEIEKALSREEIEKALMREELEKALNLKGQELRFLDLVDKAWEIELPPEEDRRILGAMLGKFLEHLSVWEAMFLAFELGRAYAREGEREVGRDV